MTLNLKENLRVTVKMYCQILKHTVLKNRFDFYKKIRARQHITKLEITIYRIFFLEPLRNFLNQVGSFEIGWSHTFESPRVLLTVARFPISVDICLMTSLSWSF